ncbi:MAG TPA: hypothetical protein VM165_00660 [Planctomycetaceae bacterium]|nr:hypothetical protein [Planctomycetaceae bacterium]
MSFHLVAEAQEEVDQASQWLDDRQFGLGNRFLTELENAYKIIQRDPTAIPEYEVPRIPRGIRRQPLPSFPYIVVFGSFAAEEIIVFAVAHTARKPG